MTFLAPLVLYGLPLLLLPVVIHLLNRLRYRTRAWAAMAFLLAATRTSSRAARVRHWLILALRVLAVAAGVLAFARPLVGGWLGGSLSGAPDAVWILVDRSPSMEALDPADRTYTVRQAAVARLASAAAALHGVRISVIDPATAHVLALPDPARLAESDAVAAGDATTPLPHILHEVARRLVEERPGRVEIWIASDMRASDWQPRHPQWNPARDLLAALPQGVRLRVLALPASDAGNRSIHVQRLMRPTQPGETPQLVLDIDRPAAGEETVTLTWTIGGSMRQEEVSLASASTRIARPLPAAASPDGAWGSVALPPDDNARDNTAWFVLPAAERVPVAVVAEAGPVADTLRLAAAPYGEAGPVSVRAVTPAAAAGDAWSDAVILWAAPNPSAEVQRLLLARVQAGAVLTLFPPDEAAAPAWADYEWATLERVESPWAVDGLVPPDGLVGPGAGGEVLALADLHTLWRRVPPAPAGARVDARFADGAPLVVRRALGAGLVVQSATRPHAEWSNLADGAILVPLLQRVIEQSPAASGGNRMLRAAEWASAMGATPYIAGPPPARDPRVQAGVYRSGAVWYAVNRDRAESDPERMSADELTRALAPVPVHVWDGAATAGDRDLAAEAWRLFVLAALLFLLVEGWLVLPRAPVRREARAT